ncbi:hypothetical protein AAG570_011852 [Ranatra chinensis]|uniref:Uncharacterized protein n=1 Tax=Ranatra chinensis TaxID=642074 RepID=A0ABD0YH40_9HEMI
MEKHGTILTRYAKYLPSYLVINTESHKSCTCSCEFCSKRLKRESPVRTFVIVNTQIEMLINTVIEALAQVNEPKLKRLVKYARNVSSIKFLLSKRKNINFIGRIYESLRSLTCYSFRAEICTVIKGTTLLVNEIDKHWKNPVFKIIMPTTFPTYDPLMNNFLSRTRGEDPMLELVESYRAGLVEEGVSPPGQLSHSSSALTVLSADGSEAALLAINPSSHRFIKHLSAILLEWEGATAAGSTRNVLEAILTEPLRLDRPVPTKSTIRLEKELNAIVENSLSDLSLMRKRFCRQRQPVLDAEGVKDRLKSNIVSRLSTPERVLVAKEIGAKKSWDKNANGNLDSRVGLGGVLGRVLSRPSLVELARAAPPQEREFLLKPSAKGGLGIASYIIGDDKMIKLEKATEHRQGVNLISAQDSPPKTESYFDFAVTGDLNLARIRQTILNTEVQKKLDRFLKANKNGN